MHGMHSGARADIDEVPERGGGFCIFPRSHHELFARDPAFADMAQASFNYPDKERAIAQRAREEQVPFVGERSNLMDIVCSQQASVFSCGSARCLRHIVCVCLMLRPGNPRFKPSLTEAYNETKKQVVRTIEPLQIAGGEGDVIITHGRTFHMGSRNLSSKIRQAMFYDVVKKDVDARFSAQVDDQGVPDRSHRNMWHDWSAQVREVVAKTCSSPFVPAKM